MTVERLARVMWRLRKNLKNKDDVVTNQELERAIMYECGTDRRTLLYNRKALIKLGWLKAVNTSRLKLTGEDLES